MTKKGKGSGGPSLANIIKGKIKLFEDSSADDVTKRKGLSKVISEIKKQNNKQEIKNHSDNFKNINEALKDNPKCKERLGELNQVVESLNSAVVTPSVPKAENKNIVPASNETKNKVEKIPPKKDPTSKPKVKKVQSIVKTNTPKVSTEKNKDMIMFKGLFKNENSQITAKLTNIENCVKMGYVKEGENPLQVASKQLIKDEITILHTIGGDDTNTTAAELVTYLSKNNYNLTVVGLPKTVDNDVYPIQQTLGAWTAAEQGAVFFENIANENTTSTRQLIIHVMHKSCLVDGHDGTKSHGYSSKLPEVFHQPWMGVR